MELITRAIRGTQDVLPADSYKWQHVEQTALSSPGISVSGKSAPRCSSTPSCSSGRWERPTDRGAEGDVYFL